MLVQAQKNRPVPINLVRGLLALLFLGAIVLRVEFFPIETSDYTVFLSQWYDFIAAHQGFAALKYSFSNYNPPYLYLLALATYLPIPKIVAIKGISILFDGLLSFFAYLILRLKYERSLVPTIGALVLLFAPTIFINSAAWGQADAMYAAFCLGSLYFLCKDRPGLACLFFGLALAFKLQAVFFFPVLLVVLLRRKLPVRTLVLIPAIFVLMLLPAFIAGRDAGSLLSIYANQISSGGMGNGSAVQFNGGNDNQSPNGGRGQFGNGRGGSGNSSSLTLNAPSFYQWLPRNAPDYWKWIGIALAGLFVIFIGWLFWKSKRALTPELILRVALVFALAIPFLLPEMHERYFYLADVLSIVCAFYLPRIFYIAIIVQLCSLFSYAPYFLHTQIVGLMYIAFAVFIMVLIAVAELVLTLFPGMQNSSLFDSPGERPAPPTSGQPATDVSPAITYPPKELLQSQE